jgi:catalase
MSGHSYRLVNTEGKSHFVKFHWKPILGVHSLVWDEAVKLAGQDPDFHRRDMFDSIENGNFFEWEFGVQILPEEDEMKFDFDILDATKIIPEDLIPVQRVGGPLRPGDSFLEQPDPGGEAPHRQGTSV